MRSVSNCANQIFGFSAKAAETTLHYQVLLAGERVGGQGGREHTLDKKALGNKVWNVFTGRRRDVEQVSVVDPSWLPGGIQRDLELALSELSGFLDLPGYLCTALPSTSSQSVHAQCQTQPGPTCSYTVLHTPWWAGSGASLRQHDQLCLRRLFAEKPGSPA